VGKQSIINETDLTNFLESGAILQIASNQFKLVWGPFTSCPMESTHFSDEKTIIYQPNFWDFISTDSKRKIGLIGTKECILETDSLLDLLNQQDQVDIHVDWKKETVAEFVEQFNWSQVQIVENNLKKTVPIIFQSGSISFSKAHLTTALKSLIEGKHYGSTYGFWENTVGYLGHTPELILEWNDASQTLCTMALAGTLDQREENSVQILKDKKILDEHQIVVDDLKLALEKVTASKNVEVSATKVLKLKYLFHLQTPMQVHHVVIDEIPKFIDQIHPTAALGIYPRKNECYKSFHEFSIQKNRGKFAAPFAFIQKSTVKVTASIRSFNFDTNKVKITSGCGITAGSLLADELNELENKRNSVKRMMGMNI
jgi:menaquinone-specific isochorismate synthase